MKTEVIMQRELFGDIISQKSKSEFFSATDLVRAGNKWRVANGLDIFNIRIFMQNKNTKEFISFLEKEYGVVKINSKGKNSHTWVHPFLFIKIALAINAKLEIKVYKWLYDQLLKYRNDSGDSYKKMTGAIFLSIKNKSKYIETLRDTANKIKMECDVKDWQAASETQLKLRDRIQENISLLCDVLDDITQAVEIGIKKAKECK